MCVSNYHDATANRVMTPCVRCGKPAEHKHHIHPRCYGGDNSPTNLAPLCVRCHIKTHGQAGDWERWGRKGGIVTAISRKSFANLKQFSGAVGQARLVTHSRRYELEAFYAMLRGGYY